MTCKECVHYDVCMDYTTLKESEFAQNFNETENLCGYFKNKTDVGEVVRCKDCKYWHNKVFDPKDSEIVIKIVEHLRGFAGHCRNEGLIREYFSTLVIISEISRIFL